MSRHPNVPRARFSRALAPSTLAVAAGLAMLATSAQAFEIDTGNADLTVRWDNTPRVNLGWRKEKRDNMIGNSAVADEGTYSFDKGDMIAQRIDWLTELDVIYQKRFGGRLSATAWYDGAYDGNSRSNPNAPLTNIPSYIGKTYSSYTDRLYRGGSGEILDAFVFGRFDLGEVPTTVKLGRHSLYWGESLFLGGNINGIAYAQNPLDLQKGFATPGVEAKELFRPLNQISGQAAVTDTLTLSAQYFFEWESMRYPEGGTYYGPVDFAFNGPDRQFISAGLGFASRGNAAEPDQSGEFGLAARWSPAWLDGTMGLYYRNYADKLPQVFLTQVGPNTSRYNLIYADNISLYGISLAKNIAGVSLGAELSYRRNTPLTSQILGVSPGAGKPGETNGPRGDTAHGLVNLLGVIPQTPLFDAATWATELTWAHLLSVNSGANLLNAVGYAPCNATATAPAKDKWDGCATSNFIGAAFAFTPTWYQVFPGTDLSLPLTYGIGLSGNAPTLFGGNQKNGSYSIGLGADVLQKYRFDLKYSDYLGVYRTNAANTAVASQNGFSTLLKDRGAVALTFKTTF